MKAFILALAASFRPAWAFCLAFATSSSSCVRTFWPMNGAAATWFHSRSNCPSRAVVPAGWLAAVLLALATGGAGVVAAAGAAAGGLAGVAPSPLLPAGVGLARLAAAAVAAAGGLFAKCTSCGPGLPLFSA